MKFTLRNCGRWIACVVVAGSFAAQRLSAAEISYSLGATLGASETAGAPGVNAANWNAITNNSQTISNPVDSTGASTNANSVFAGQSFGITSNNAKLNDAHLFQSWVDQSDSATSTLTVSNVPYATYDVYIYMHNDRDANPDDRTGGFSIDGVDRFARGPSSNSAYDPGQGGTYHLSPDSSQSTATGTTAGDYVLFTGLTDPTLTVSFFVGLANGTVERNKFVGLQIVQTPEPASLVLLGLGAIGLVIAGRRRRSA